jgi:chromate transport protein ChrA
MALQLPLPMMEDYLVCHRRLVSPKNSLDPIGVSILLPGLSSTELVIFLGYRLGRIPVILVTGACSSGLRS